MSDLTERINAAWDDVYEAIQEQTITRAFGDRILGRIAAIRSAIDAAAAPLPSEPQHTADCRLGWDAMGDACTCRPAPLPPEPLDEHATMTMQVVAANRIDSLTPAAGATTSGGGRSSSEVVALMETQNQCRRYGTCSLLVGHAGAHDGGLWLGQLVEHGDVIEYDQRERWLVLTQPGGASAVIARDVDEGLGAWIAGQFR